MVNGLALVTKDWIYTLLNQVIAHCFLQVWHNWKKPYGRGNKHWLANHHTIMVGSSVAKFSGSIVEHQLSEWAEKDNKSAVEHAGFQPKHSTIVHLICIW